MASLNIETNVETIDIIRNGETVGTISVDLTDVGLLSRLKSASEESKAEYEAFQAKAESLSSDEVFDEMDRIDKILRGFVDKALCAKVSDVVFGDLYCFTSKNGVTVVEQFLSGVLDLFDKRTKAEAAKVEKHIGKYKK